MTDVPKITGVLLPPQLTEEHRRAIVKYGTRPRLLTRQEWPLALAAFDLLHSGYVILNDETLTFQACYLRWIDEPYATPFIHELLKAADIEADGSRLVIETWRAIVTALSDHGLAGETVEARGLLVYCLYWWRSFGKGYVREVSVFRNLEQSGVRFDAHDLRDPDDRRSLHDLTVLGRHGDIKTSTYFIHLARAFPLRSDFYIVRLWDGMANEWLDLVLLKPEVWRELDGPPTPCTWERVARVLPTPAQVEMRGEQLVVVMYDEWKDRVLKKQTPKGELTR